MFYFGFGTDKGKTRHTNQDAFFVLPRERCFVVADGVGGQNSGEKASRLTISIILAYLNDFPIEEVHDDNELRDYLLDCIRLANAEIYRLSRESDENVGMATTLTLLYIKNDKAYVVNIGDSRAYLIRDSAIKQITEDHTYVNDLVKKKIITRDEATSHPDRNMITRAIGAEQDVKPDFYQLKVFEEDVILLCTDGLYNEVSDNFICGVASTGMHMRDVCARLVKSANDNGGKDNITIICVKI